MRIWISIVGLALGFTILLGCSDEAHICTSKYASGELESEVPCDKYSGTYDGEMRVYHKSGKLWKTKYFVDGIEEDTARFYFYKSGNLLKSIPMEAGKREGEAITYRDDGSVERKEHYVFGFKEGQDITYFSDGSPREIKSYKEGMLNGPYEKYHTSGELAVKGSHAFDRKIDKWIHFRSDGTRSAYFSYYFDKKHGGFGIFRSDGLPYLTGEYYNDRVDGVVKYFNKEGAIVYSENWEDGKNLEYDPASGLEQLYTEGDAGFEFKGFKVLVQGDSVAVFE